MNTPDTNANENATHLDTERVDGDDRWDCDDMLAWLRRRCSTIRVDPIRIHEIGYTLDCIDETEPMRPNRIMASVTAPTLHAALTMAIRSIDLLDEERQRGSGADIEAREQEADALRWWRSQQ